MTGSSTILSRTTIVMFGLLAQGLARFFYTVIVGRTAGPETLGEVNGLLSLAVYLSLFWPAPLGVAGSRFLPSASGGRGDLAGTVSQLKRSFWLSSAVTTLLGTAIALLLTADLLAALISGLLIASYGGYTFVRGTLMGEEKPVRATVLDTVSSVVALTLLVLVVVVDAPALFLLPLSIGYVIFSVLGWPRSERAVLPPDQRRQLLRFTSFSAIWMLASGGLLPIAMIAAQIFTSELEAGIFAAGMTLATPANMIAQALSQVLLPYMAARAHSPAVLRPLVLRLFAVSAAGFTVVFGGLYALAPWLLDLFYGARFADGASAMQGLLAGVYLVSCATVPIAALMATDRQRLVSTASVITVAVGIAIMMGTAPSMGATGILVGFITAPALNLIAVGAAIIAAPARRR